MVQREELELRVVQNVHNLVRHRMVAPFLGSVLPVVLVPLIPGLAAPKLDLPLPAPYQIRLPPTLPPISPHPRYTPHRFHSRTDSFQRSSTTPRDSSSDSVGPSTSRCRTSGSPDASRAPPVPIPTPPDSYLPASRHSPLPAHSRSTGPPLPERPARSQLVPGSHSTRPGRSTQVPMGSASPVGGHGRRTGTGCSSSDGPR